MNLNPQVILITGPASSGKTTLANFIQRGCYLHVQIWDEPILKGRGSCKAAIRAHVKKKGIAIITSCFPNTVQDSIKVNQVIKMFEPTYV